MAGPWDKYQKPAESGPWAKYGAPVAVEQPPVAEQESGWLPSFLVRNNDRMAKEVNLADAPAKLDTMGRGLADVLTLGMADELAAAGDTAADKLRGREGDYQKNLAAQRARDEFDKANRGDARLGGQIMGGLMQGVGLAKNGLSLTAKAIEKGAPWYNTAIRAALESGTLSAAHGFGSGDGLEDRLDRAKDEGKWGLAVGPAATVLGSVGSKVLQEGRDFIASPKVIEALSGLSRGARKYIDRELADPAKVEAMKAQLEKLGPDAMMADVSPEWFGVARGAASRPGTRELVVKPLEDRAAAANARLRGDVKTSLGPDPIPSEVQTGIEGDRNLVSRLYGPAFAERQPYDFTPITNDLDRSIVNLRGDAQRVLQRVRGMMNTHGTEEVTNDPAVAFQTRQAIDGLLANETNPKVVNALSEARQMIDDGLTRSVPRIKEIDAQYHELSRQIEGLGRGRPILNNEASAMRPSELEQELVEGGQPHGMLVGPSAEALRARQGTVGEVYRAIGTKANDTTALRNIVRGEGDWNRSKLALLFGQRNADDALNAIDREIKFGDTANRITRNSETAVTNRFGDFLDEAGKPMTIPADTNLTGGALNVGHKLARALLRQNAEAGASKFAEDLGRLSVAKGDERDALIQALANRGNRLQELKDPAMRQLLEALLQGSARSTVPMLPSSAR